MTISFPCEGCGRRLKVEGARPGAAIACPKCGRRLTIPAASVPAPAAATTAARPPLQSFDEPAAPRPASRPAPPPAPKPAPTPAVAPALDPFDDLADGPAAAEATAPPAATLPPATFPRARAATPSRAAAPAPGRSPAIIAAIVGGAVVALGVAIGLGVLLARTYGGNKGEDEANPNDTVAQLSAEQDQAARQNGALRFANPEQERVFLEMLDRLEAFPKLLAEVRDKESAERLAPKIREAFRDLLAMNKEAITKIPRPGQAFDELTTRHRERFLASQTAFQEEAKRLQGKDFTGPVDRALQEVLQEFLKQGGFGPGVPGMPVGSLPGYPGPNAGSPGPAGQGAPAGGVK